MSASGEPLGTCMPGQFMIKAAVPATFGQALDHRIDDLHTLRPAFCDQPFNRRQRPGLDRILHRQAFQPACRHCIPTSVHQQPTQLFPMDQAACHVWGVRPVFCVHERCSILCGCVEGQQVMMPLQFDRVPAILPASKMSLFTISRPSPALWTDAGLFVRRLAISSFTPAAHQTF